MTDMPPKNPADDKNRTAADPSADDARDDEDLFADLAEPADETPEETIARLREENLALQRQTGEMSQILDRYQRRAAETEKKIEDLLKTITRIENKAKDDIAFAATGFLKEILPVADAMDRGLAALPEKTGREDPYLEKIVTGFEGVRKQLSQAFNRFGVKEVDPLGESFDPNKHEAVAAQEEEGAEPATVIAVVEKGYEMKGRVIRAAKVVVTPDA